MYGGVSMGRYRPANSNENGFERPYDGDWLEAAMVVVTLDELRPWWCLIRDA
jgi:hypothetical protein